MKAVAVRDENGGIISEVYSLDNGKHIHMLQYDIMKMPHGGLRFYSDEKRIPHVLFLEFNTKEYEFVNISNFSKEVCEIIKKEIQNNAKES